MAEILAIGPRNQMQEAATKLEIPVDIDWTSSISILQLAVTLKPYDANLHFDLGRMAWWWANQRTATAEQRYERLDLSLTHLRQAIGARPTWGQGWAELANVQLQAGAWLQASNSLDKAMYLAPYDADSQWMILWTGFAAWDLLDSKERGRLLKIAREVIRVYSTDLVLDPAFYYGREKVIEELVRGTRAERRFNELLKKRRRREEERGARN